MMAGHRQADPTFSRRTQPRDPRASRRKLAWLGAVLSVLALVITSMLWPGYEEHDTPPEDASVWALNSSAGRYAPVNTQINELASVSPVSNPTQVIQRGAATLLFADGLRHMSMVDAALPADLADRGAADLLATPAGTTSVGVGDERILFASADGTLTSAPFSAPSEGFQVLAPGDVEDFQSEGARAVAPLRTVASSITPGDTVVALLPEVAGQFQILRIDAVSGEITSTQDVAGNLGQSVQISEVEGRWVVLDTQSDSARIWVEGLREPAEISETVMPLLRTSGSGEIVVSDPGGLYLVDPESGGVTRALTAPAGSVASVPTQVGDSVYAAWLAAGGGPGILWDSSRGGATVPLDYGSKQLETSPAPRIFTNGNRTIVNDITSGWVWDASDGSLVPTSQDWQADATSEDSTVDAEVEEVLEPKPPVAMPDTFGVRVGEDTVLPVLLNDFDPNNDVLSLDAPSLGDLEENFGSLSLVNHGQQLVVSVSPSATGTASFTYRATDGTAAEGLLSGAATVSLTVIPEDDNRRPFFAGVGVEDYLGQWPTPAVPPGQITSLQVLPGWVDPDGDPLFLASAVSEDPRVQVLSDPGGVVTVRHLDADSDDFSPVSVNVVVSDARGQSETKALIFAVEKSPPIVFTSTAFTGVVGNLVEVNLGDSVTGGVGALSITELDASAGEESVRLTHSARGLRFTANASAPGSYPLKVTVADTGGATANATVRLVVEAEEQARVTTTPVTVFVRPSEDTTIDLMSAVSNPASSVLLISDLVVDPAGEAELSADLVGQQLIHASGRTSDDAPGLLGRARYTVSDGSGEPNMSASGMITFMAARPDDSYPIASNRWITVSGGAQVDIPVLDWAAAPVGAQLAVDQSSVRIDQSDSEDDTAAGLAFATPSMLRYLAPTVPGEYSITYTIFRMGNPALSATGTVNVIVVGEDTEELSTPDTLVGRALAGGTVTIPLAMSEARMRGENYVLDAVASQPMRGTAAMSADGLALTYTAHPGSGGQDTFTYQVRTASGRTAVGQVKVGVLDATVPPAPVLYSRYLQMAVGGRNQVSVFPLDNALDPSGGAVNLVEVWPNEPAGTPEYREAERRVSVNLESGEVVIRGAEVEGASSFFYKAVSERGDQATGLIVIKSIHNPTQDLPVVVDTRLTAENLNSLPTGIDVLSDKTVWATGPVEDLKLEMWGNPSDFKASGSSISGPVPDGARTVPFRVRGKSFEGTEVASYGFLKIPAMKDVPPALRSTFVGLEVAEGQAVSVELTEIIVDPMKEGLRFDGPATTATGARAGAECLTSGTTLTYVAGEGAPWQDACAVSIRTRREQGFTVLSVPVKILPKDPQPTLLAASIEASPGSRLVTYDLNQMVDWHGGAAGSAELLVVGTPSLFTLSQRGNLITVAANADATPSRVETVQVMLGNFPEVLAAPLTLTVGPAAGSAPRGGVARQDCSAAGGSTSCTIVVVGPSVQGQTNFAPESALTLVEDSVVGPANCPSVSFAYESPTTVRATWGADSPGRADCTGSFVVQDVQGRRSLGADAGQVFLNLQGLPPQPHVTWKEAKSETVAFQVAVQGEAYPAVEAFTWSGAGGEGSCPLAGNCTISVPAASLGEAKTFEFKAVSKTGTSPPTSATAWTYRAASTPHIMGWEPNTDGTSVSLYVEANAADTSNISVEGGGPVVAVPQGAGSSEVTVNVPLGTVPTGVVVRAESRLTKPAEGVVVPEAVRATATAQGIHAVGAPDVKAELKLEGRTATISMGVTDTNGVGGGGTSMRHQLCYTVSGAGETCLEEEVGPSETRTIGDLPYGHTIAVRASAWGVADSGTKTFPRASRTTEPQTVGIPQPKDGLTYSIAAAAQPCGSGGYEACYQWNTAGEPDFGEAPEGTQREIWFVGGYSIYGSVAEAVSAQGFPESWPQLMAKYVANGAGSPEVEIGLSGSSPGRVYVALGSKSKCPTDDPGGLRPFDRQPTNFGSVSGPIQSSDGHEGPKTYTWTLALPPPLLANGDDSLVWTCHVPSPLPPTPPGGDDGGEGQ